MPYLREALNLLNRYRSINGVTANFLLALYFASVFNLPVFYHLYEILSKLTYVKPGFVISIPIFLVSALNLVFLPFSFRFIQKPFFIVLLTSSSLTSYTMLKYKVVFDYSMVQNIFETYQAEALEYLNASLIVWFLITGALPCLLLLWFKLEPVSIYKGLVSRLISMIISIVTIFIIACFYYKDYISVGRNNNTINNEIVPISICVNIFKYITKTYFTSSIPFSRIGVDAKDVSKFSSKPTLLVIALGETARSGNYSLNGYNKPTNVFSEAREGVISFRNVSSCGTATAISIPCMFSNMSRQNYEGDIATNQENLLDVLSHAEISILWKNNNGGCKTVCDRVPTVDVIGKSNKFCDRHSCFDEALLENLEQEISTMKGNRVIVLHLIGSHGPSYFRRYPESHRFFKPDCGRSDIENCSRLELINTYDNTIRYTDYVLSGLIDKLRKLEKNYNTAMIYLSDHGESLGENGIYLHGLPYKIAPKEQTQIPFIIWFSAGFNELKKLNNECLRKNALNKSYSHDNLFHSVLGIMDVETNEYNIDLDIFAPCRQNDPN